MDSDNGLGYCTRCVDWESARLVSIVLSVCLFPVDVDTFGVEEGGGIVLGAET